MGTEMSFDAADFLAGLFGDGSVAPAAVPSGEPTGDALETPAFGPDDNPGGAPEAATSGDHAPATGGATVGGEPPGNLDFGRWVLRPDARGRVGWEAPDLPEAERWWAHPDQGATASEPCPRCGSLELWWDLLGQPHCQHCERAGFERAGEIAELAVRLRAASGVPPWEPCRGEPRQFVESIVATFPRHSGRWRLPAPGTSTSGRRSKGNKKGVIWVGRSQEKVVQ
jgi:hypothetical protein